MTRPRTFAWLFSVSGPVAQIIYDDPRVGCSALKILADVKLEETDKRELDDLIKAYPAPATTDVQ